MQYVDGPSRKKVYSTVKEYASEMESESASIASQSNVNGVVEPKAKRARCCDDFYSLLFGEDDVNPCPNVVPGKKKSKIQNEMDIYNSEPSLSK